MPRTRRNDRLQQLIDSALETFIQAGGYRRAQIADVARHMGIAPGTVYLYVESKEALFDLVVRRADVREPLDPPPDLPVPTPPQGATLAYVRERLRRGGQLETLMVALRRRRVTQPRAELEGIVREMYGHLRENRRGIKLADATARDFPGLANLWFENARRLLLVPLVQYLDDRVRRGHFRRLPDVEILARLLLEICVMWAVHRHWDPQPAAMDEEAAEETAVQLIVHGLVT